MPEVLPILKSFQVAKELTWEEISKLPTEAPPPRSRETLVKKSRSFLEIMSQDLTTQTLDLLTKHHPINLEPPTPNPEGVRITMRNINIYRQWATSLAGACPGPLRHLLQSVIAEPQEQQPLTELNFHGRSQIGRQEFEWTAFRGIEWQPIPGLDICDVTIKSHGQVELKPSPFIKQPCVDGYSQCEAERPTYTTGGNYIPKPKEVGGFSSSDTPWTTFIENPSDELKRALDELFGRFALVLARPYLEHIKEIPMTVSRFFSLVADVLNYPTNQVLLRRSSLLGGVGLPVFGGLQGTCRDLVRLLQRRLTQKLVTDIQPLRQLSIKVAKLAAKEFIKSNHITDSVVQTNIEKFFLFINLTWYLNAFGAVFKPSGWPKLIKEAFAPPDERIRVAFRNTVYREPGTGGVGVCPT